MLSNAADTKDGLANMVVVSRSNIMGFVLGSEGWKRSKSSLWASFACLADNLKWLQEFCKEKLSAAVIFGAFGSFDVLSGWTGIYVGIGSKGSQCCYAGSACFLGAPHRNWRSFQKMYMTMKWNSYSLTLFKYLSLLAHRTSVCCWELGISLRLWNTILPHTFILYGDCLKLSCWNKVVLPCAGVGRKRKERMDVILDQLSV